jgi:hypothetical protein
MALWRDVSPILHLIMTHNFSATSAMINLG